MNRSTKVLAAAAVLSTGFAAPAMAAYVRIGSVDVGYRMDRDSTWSRFGGHMQGLRLVAGSSDIRCKRVRVRFGDGQTQNVFSGVLFRNRPVDVDLQGGRRRVEGIDFTCRSDRFRGGKIFIRADVGRYRAEWRRSPYWASYWSRVFTWGPANKSSGYDPNYWVSLGHDRFVGGRGREAQFPGWGGRSVERIGLRANAEASCTRLHVRFGNGERRDLDAGRVYRMDAGRFYAIDLPGGNRRIERLSLTCRPIHGSAVSVQVFARK